MAEGYKLGSIYYEVDADTTAFLKAEAEINKSLDKQVKEFEKAEKAISEFEKSITSAGATVNKAGQVFDKNGKISKGLTEQYRMLSKEANNLRSAANGAATSAANASKNLSGVGRNAGQAGIQIQQFVGQIQGGQDAMLALSQQGADLGFVLGAPLAGAIVGIGASIAGFLIPQLIGADAEVRSLDDSISLMIENFNKLSETQQKIAKNALIVKLEEQKKQASALSKEVNELQSALISAQQLQSGGKGSALINSIIGEDPKKVEADLVKAKSALVAVSLEIKDTNKSIEDLGKDTGVEKRISSIAESLTSQIIALKDGEEASIRYSIAQELGLKVGEKIPPVIDAQIDSLIRLKKEKAEEIRLTQEKSRADAQALKEYESQMMRELAIEAKALEAKRRRGDQVTGKVEGIASGLDPLAKLTAERDARLALVAEYEALETANYQVAVDARAAIDADYEAKKQAAAEKSFAMQSQGNKMLIDGLNSLSGTVSQVFTGMITQTMTAQDAVRGLANAVLNDAINSLIQMGLQAVKNMIIGQTAQTAATAASVAAGATVASAWAPAAAAVSLASYGANAAPAGAGIAATYGLTQSLAVAGGRNYGGGVGYGSNYEVAEGGRTELYIPKRGNPMLMGAQGGQVVSNSDLMAAMGGGGGQANIDIQIINQGTPQQVTNQQQGVDESTGRQFLKVWVADFNSKGQTYRAITTGTNAKGRTY